MIILVLPRLILYK